jgi:hypothetical protein
VLPGAAPTTKQSKVNYVNTLEAFHLSVPHLPSAKSQGEALLKAWFSGVTAEGGKRLINFSTMSNTNSVHNCGSRTLRTKYELVKRDLKPRKASHWLQSSINNGRSSYLARGCVSIFGDLRSGEGDRRVPPASSVSH